MKGALKLGLVWALSLAVLGQSGFELGQKVMAASKGRWYPARIVGLMEGGLYRVHYQGYGDAYDENLTADSLKVVKASYTYREGERVRVDWQGGSYEADIQDCSDRGYKVHYVGYGNTYDEWVDPSRVHPYSTTYNWQVGDRVQVMWGSGWYYATILNTDSYHNYQVHYEGWDSGYDETVSYTRVRAR